MKTISHLRMPIAALVGFVLFLACMFGLATEEVGSSRSLLRQFWISLEFTTSLGIAAFVVTCWHGFCARMGDAEQEIGKRFRGKPGLRSLESRSCRIVAWTLFGLFAALTLVIGGIYMHSRNL